MDNISVILRNLTKNTIITKDLKEAKSLKDKSLGLLLKENPRSLLFNTRFGIHTFFLRDSIDVIVLSDTNKVVITAAIKPNRIFIYNPKHSRVIELPSCTIAKSGTRPGHTLEIKRNL